MLNKSNSRYPIFLKIIISFILGAIAVFSYAPFDIWLLAFVSFSGLLILVSNASAKRAMILGLSWGIGYFLAGVHWVYVSIKLYGELPLVLAVLILGLFVLYLSLYSMLFALGISLSKKWFKPYSIKQLVLFAPILWQITEFLRATILSGFAWLQFGYTQLHTPLASLFPVIGINGVELLFTFLCGLLAYLFVRIFITHKNHFISKANFIALFWCVALFFAPLSLNLITWIHHDLRNNVSISLVQGNITQLIKWDPQQLQKTLGTYRALTERASTQSDIVIWPEAAITSLEINQQPYLHDLDKFALDHDIAVAVGIINLDYQHDKIYNTLIVLGDETPYQYPTENRYNKHHLVPFGEYTPLEFILKPISQLLNIPMSSMSSGNAVQAPLVMKGYHFLTAICYEIILSNQMLNNFTPETQFLLTVSNDAWFGDTIGPWQHLQMAQTRALEFGRVLLRSTNNGITAVIMPTGEISVMLPQFDTNILTTSAAIYSGQTPYSKWGNSFFYGLILILFISLFIKKRS